MFSKETLLKLILIAMGVALSIKCIQAFLDARNAVDEVIAVILAVVLGFMAGLCFAYAFLPQFCRNLTNSILMPRVFRRTKAPAFSRVQGLIMQNDFDAAVEELKQILKAHPYNKQAVEMLVQIHVESLQDTDAALKVLSDYFDSRPSVNSGDSALVLQYVDLCEELGRFSAAAALLERQLRIKAYSESDLKLMHNRLIAII